MAGLDRPAETGEGDSMAVVALFLSWIAGFIRCQECERRGATLRIEPTVGRVQVRWRCGAGRRPEPASRWSRERGAAGVAEPVPSADAALPEMSSHRPQRRKRTDGQLTTLFRLCPVGHPIHAPAAP